MAGGYEVAGLAAGGADLMTVAATRAPGRVTAGPVDRRRALLAVALAALTGELAMGLMWHIQGGADPTGSGLRGLADRVAALDGQRAIDSPHGCGTRLTIELPCG